VSDPTLPPELRDLEEGLSRRPLPEPSEALKARVLGSMRLSRERERAGGLWSWAAGVAVTAALLANLSSNAAPWGLGAPAAPDRASIERAAMLIRETFPEIPEGEALRQAILMAAAERILPSMAPLPSPGALTLDSTLEHLEDGD
jgi:hypothetical protein